MTDDTVRGVDEREAEAKRLRAKYLAYYASLDVDERARADQGRAAYDARLEAAWTRWGRCAGCLTFAPDLEALGIARHLMFDTDDDTPPIPFCEACEDAREEEREERCREMDTRVMAFYRARPDPSSRDWRPAMGRMTPEQHPDAWPLTDDRQNPEHEARVLAELTAMRAERHDASVRYLGRLQAIWTRWGERLPNE